MKVLAFGYVPKWKGGKQLTGLATGIFDLHNAINELDNDIQVTLAATDIHLSRTHIDSTPIVGWNKRTLLKFALTQVNTILSATLLLWKHREFWSILRPIKALPKILFIHYAIKKENPAVVHFHGASWCALSKAIDDQGHKKILRIHGINGNNTSIPEYKKHQLLEKTVGEVSFDSVSFVAESVAKTWNREYGAPAEKQFVVVNGFDSGIFQVTPTSSQNKKFDLITIGALTDNKGQMRVLKALYMIQESGHSLSYLIVGDGDSTYRQELIAFVKLHNLNVEFLDYVPQTQLPQLLSISSFFILPSQREGFGKVFIESIACGTPVLIPRHLPLVQEDGILSEVNSIIMDGSEPSQIQKTLHNLVHQPVRYNRDEVSKSIQHLSWPILAKEYCKYIAQLS